MSLQICGLRLPEIGCHTHANKCTEFSRKLRLSGVSNFAEKTLQAKQQMTAVSGLTYE